MGPTRVNRKLSFESGEEQIKGYGKVTQNTEIFSTKYGNNILEVGSPAYSIRQSQCVMILRHIIAWRQLFDVKSIFLPDTYLHKMIISQNIATYIIYRQISNIRRTKSHNLNASRLALQLLLRNLFKPGVK